MKVNHVVAAGIATAGTAAEGAVPLLSCWRHLQTQAVMVVRRTAGLAMHKVLLYDRKSALNADSLSVPKSL